MNIAQESACAIILSYISPLFHRVYWSLQFKGGSDVSIIGVAIPYLSLFVVLLSNYYERTMYKLLKFQSKLIDLDTEDDIPNWFSHEFYGSLGSTRLIRDWAQIYVIIPISSAALLLLYSRWEDYSPHYRTSYLYSVGAASICLVFTTYFLVSNIYSKYCYNEEKHRKFTEKCKGAAETKTKE